MPQTLSSLVLGIDEFLTRYGDNPRYELVDADNHPVLSGFIGSIA